jgi:two-component system LytT family response regulator
VQYRLRVSLRELEQRVDPCHFRRIHRSTLVNIDRIKEVQPWFGGDYVVLLRDGTQLRASRTYSAELLEPLQ